MAQNNAVSDEACGKPLCLQVYHPGEQLVLGGMGLATIVEVG